MSRQGSARFVRIALAHLRLLWQSSRNTSAEKIVVCFSLLF
jgi:hypothetical protein